MAMIVFLVVAVLSVLTKTDGKPLSLRAKRQDEGLSSLQTVIEQQGSAIDTLESQLTAAQSDLATLKTTFLTLQDKQSKRVGFSVRFKYDPISIALTTGTLKFDNVVYSTGGSYDTSTGIFRAPVSGMYVFYVNLMSEDGDEDDDSLEVALVKEGTNLDLAHADGRSSDDQGTLLMPVYLTAGQRVWVQHDWGAMSFRGSYWTVFSGYLVSAD